MEKEDGFTIISGEGSQVGAPHLVLSPRLGSRLRKWQVHSHFVIASFGTTPPLVAFSLYLPAFGTHGETPFEQILSEFHTALEIMQKATPGSFILGAADCNTQLLTVPDQVGPRTGTNERPHDQERADLIAHVLASVGLTVPSSYADLGPTRFPWEGQSTTQKPSVIDYLFASPKLITQMHTSDLPTPDTNTDHIPIGMTAHAPYASRRERRQQFESQQANAAYWKDRVSTRWEPSTVSGLRQHLKHARFHHLDQVAPELIKAARATTSVEEHRQTSKRSLLQCIKKARDPIIRKAYQIRLRQYRREQREARERSKILAWARGDNWDFSREAKIPTRMKYPQTLNGDPDRGHWGNQLGQYLQNLYAADPQEEAQLHSTLTRILLKAQTHAHEPLVCNPNELRDLLRALPPHKAAGPDGVPSQLLKALTIQQIADISLLFTALANDLDYKPDKRPDAWTQALAMLLPKEAKADTLDRHRAIALMSQIQKLYSKWLLAQMNPIIDPLISEHQAGFRRNRQASEILQIIGKLIELALEWQTPLTIMRLDMRKAFDRVKQSSILKTLEDSPLHPKIVFNAARELVGNTMHPTIYGCIPEDPVPLAQGTKQGAPESGMYFVATLNHALAPLTDKWDHTHTGCQLGDVHIHHLLFADDLLLVGPSPSAVLKMFQEAKPALAQIGLEVNDAKTAYLTTHPHLATHLPGTNANDTGMKILGRTFTISDNTQQDMDLKIGHAWARFNRLRHILRANTPLPHRLRIFTSCVGQALLWASETWHITRKRLQRIRGVELSMMRTLIKCPPLPPQTDDNTRFATHKAHIRKTLQDHKYEGLDRQWVKRYYSWAGHLARLPPHRLAKKALHEKSLAWWRKRQQNPEGFRHVRRRGNLSRWENPLGRHHPSHENWPENAQFRDRWKLFFPAFEKRLFGPNCPHTFDPQAETRHPEPQPSSKSTGHGNPGQNPPRTPWLSSQKDSEPSVGPPQGSRKHPRDTSAVGASDAVENPYPKRAKKAASQQTSPQTVLTPSQVVRNWQKALDQPLISLLHPQDVSSHGSRLGQRRRAGAGARAGARAGTARGSAFLSQSNTADTQLLEQASQAAERVGRAADRAASSDRGRRNGGRHAGSATEGEVERCDATHQRNVAAAHRGQSAPSTRGSRTHIRRASISSTSSTPSTSSTSSSTSTSSSASSLSEQTWRPQGKEKGKGKGRRQRRKGKSKGKGKVSRPHAQPNRVLGEDVEAEMGDGSWRRRQEGWERERRQDDDKSNDDDRQGERRQNDDKSTDDDRRRKRRLHDDKPNDDYAGWERRRHDDKSNDDRMGRERWRNDDKSNDDKSDDDRMARERRRRDDKSNDDDRNASERRRHDDKSNDDKSDDDRMARERRQHDDDKSYDDDRHAPERRQHDDKSNDDRMEREGRQGAESSTFGDGPARPLQRHHHPPARSLRRSDALG